MIRSVPEGDDRLRWNCTRCGYIHYENPKIVVGSLACWEDKVLLCRRAIEPRRGLWTLPSGFMENGETVEEGALRETREEACAEVELVRLYTIFTIRHISQVYLLFLANLRANGFAAGDETMEARLFAAEEVPWGEIAFTAVSFCLTQYVRDRGNTDVVHTGSYTKSA